MEDFLKEKIYYHSLNLACENNFNFLANLKKHYSSFEKAWLSEDYWEIQDLSDNRGETWQKFLERKKLINLEEEWEKLINNQVDLILISDNKYPLPLKEIHQPPLGLYIKGELINELPKIAIVGTRKSTNYGKQITEKLARELSEAGVVVVSGLAEGIDTFSHKSTIEAGGQTIAVLGTGFNRIFPSFNIKLAEKISKNGCLISQYYPDTIGARHQFPARNKIISGISIGVVVVEAPEKSGALITAKIALEQNREVFAIPGSVFSQNSIGPNELIKQGAKLVSSIEDILIELNLPLPEKNNLSQKNNLTLEERIILEIIKKLDSPIGKPKIADEIIAESGFSPQKTNELLTMLTLKSLIEDSDGKYWIKD